MANIPIFSALGAITWGAANITAANTAKDGTGTVDTVSTAKLVTGSYIQKLIIRPRGTNVASVMRVFINNGLTNVTAANNVLFTEVGLAASTVSEVAALAGYEVPINIAMPPGFKINVTLGTAVAGGFSVTVVGGDY